MSNLPFTLPGCDQPAAARIEVYSPDAAGDPFGSLDASVYVCAQHEADAVAATWVASMTPYRVGMTPGIDRTCGESYVFPTGNLGGRK